MDYARPAQLPALFPLFIESQLWKTSKSTMLQPEIRMLIFAFRKKNAKSTVRFDQMINYFLIFNSICTLNQIDEKESGLRPVR